MEYLQARRQELSFKSFCCGCSNARLDESVATEISYSSHQVGRTSYAYPGFSSDPVQSQQLQEPHRTVGASGSIAGPTLVAAPSPLVVSRPVHVSCVPWSTREASPVRRLQSSPVANIGNFPSQSTSSYFPAHTSRRTMEGGASLQHSGSARSLGASLQHSGSVRSLAGSLQISGSCRSLHAPSLSASVPSYAPLKSPAAMRSAAPLNALSVRSALASIHKPNVAFAPAPGTTAVQRLGSVRALPTHSQPILCRDALGTSMRSCVSAQEVLGTSLRRCVSAKEFVRPVEPVVASATEGTFAYAHPPSVLPRSVHAIVRQDGLRDDRPAIRAAVLRCVSTQDISRRGEQHEVCNSEGICSNSNGAHLENEPVLQEKLMDPTPQAPTRPAALAPLASVPPLLTGFATDASAGEQADTLASAEQHGSQQTPRDVHRKGITPRRQKKANPLLWESDKENQLPAMQKVKENKTVTFDCSDKFGAHLMNGALPDWRALSARTPRDANRAFA